MTVLHPSPPAAAPPRNPLRSRSAVRPRVFRICPTAATPSGLARSSSAGGAPAAPDESDVDRAVAGLLRLLIDVLDGRRSPAHLEAHLAPGPLGYWRAVTEQRRLRTERSGGGAGRRPPVRPGRIHVFRPHPDAAEIAVCLRYAVGRDAGGTERTARALAARIEAAGRGRWRCTALRLC